VADETEVFATRLTPAQARGVKAFAAAHHMTKSAAVMQLIAFGLAHEQQVRSELRKQGSAAARRYLDGRS
jgi:hypothetical protein